MSESRIAPGYAAPPERARKIAANVRQAVNADSQASIAAAIGVSPATVSRLISEHLDHVAAILAHLGLKLVSEDKVCIERTIWEHHCRVVRRVYATEDRAREILEEDAE